MELLRALDAAVSARGGDDCRQVVEIVHDVITGIARRNQGAGHEELYWRARLRSCTLYRPELSSRGKERCTSSTDNVRLLGKKADVG